MPTGAGLRVQIGIIVGKTAGTFVADQRSRVRTIRSIHLF